MEEIRKGINQFYVGEDPKNPDAKITFVPRGEDRIIIDHVIVSESLQGKGLGRELLNRVVELARQENKKIIPVCPYAKKVMTRDEAYADVLAL